MEETVRTAGAGYMIGEPLNREMIAEFEANRERRKLRAKWLKQYDERVNGR